MPGPHLNDPDWHPWSCKAFSPVTPEPIHSVEQLAEWNPAECSAGLKDCSKTRCCATPGMRCYAKNPFWAQCMDICSGPDWSCKEIGDRAPAPTTTDAFVPGEIATIATTTRPDQIPNWLALQCSLGRENCAESRCCATRGHQCYAKNDTFALCQPSCSPSQNGQQWTCAKLGFRVPTSTSTSTVTSTTRTSTTITTTTVTWSTSTTTTTTTVMSTFCFAVCRQHDSEGELIKKQHSERIGIFACDDAAVLSTIPWELAPGTQALLFDDAVVGVSDVGFAANARLFQNAWQAVKRDGRYKNYDWTIKVDPDAVLMPNRLWKVLSPHTGKNTFINNCGMFNVSALYGSLEAVTRPALEEFFLNFDDSCDWMLWRPWGEDLFMQKCFKQMGILGDKELGIVSDQRCWDSALPESQGCRSTEYPAFHPYKSLHNWSQCWNETVQAEGDQLRTRVQTRIAHTQDKMRKYIDQKERSMAWRKAQLAAGLARRDEEERRRAMKAKQAAANKAAKNQMIMPAKLSNSVIFTVTNTSQISSMDDKSSIEYSKALAKSQVVKTLLHVGDVVQVRDLASQKWRPGNVTSMDPVAVKPDGWTVGFTWDIVDIIPWRPESEFMPGDHVVIARGQERSVDVAEGPIGRVGNGIVKDSRKSVSSSEDAVLIEAQGVEWWYRVSSLVQEHPLPVQTCELMGCQVAAPIGESSIISVKKRKLRGDGSAPQQQRRICRCDPGCVSVGRCCSDFVDMCMMRSIPSLQ